jgi:hypothetical protein
LTPPADLKRERAEDRLDISDDDAPICDTLGAVNVATGIRSKQVRIAKIVPPPSSGDVGDGVAVGNVGSISSITPRNKYLHHTTVWLDEHAPEVPHLKSKKAEDTFDISDDDAPICDTLGAGQRHFSSNMAGFSSVPLERIIPDNSNTTCIFLDSNCFVCSTTCHTKI